MNIFSRITARTMAQNRTRTIVTIIGVILSTAMITAVATFGVSFQQFLVDYSISRDGDWHLLVQNIDEADEKMLTDSSEVEQWAAVTEFGYALFEPVQENSPDMPYLYVQSLSREALQMLPVSLFDGRLPENENEILIPTYLQANEDQENETSIGDVLTLELGERTCDGERMGRYNSYMDGSEGKKETFVPRETKSFVVVGIYDSWPGEAYGGAGYGVLAGPQIRENSDALENQSTAIEKNGSQNLEDVFLRLKHPRNVYKFAKEKLDGLDGGYAYSFNTSLLRWLGVSDNDNFYTVTAGLMILLLVVIITGSVTLIYNAFSISLRERTAQFGLLASVGATKRQLRSAMRFEALFVSALGIPLGILAGVGGIGVTLHFIGQSITNWIHGSRMGIALVVTPWSVIAAAVIAFLTIMLSVWIPSRRIRRISPLEAIRANEDVKIRPQEVKTGGLVSRLFGLEGMLAEKNYKRDRKKYRATVVSLTMSMVLFMAAALFNIYLVRTGGFVLEAPAVDLQYRMYEHGEDDTASQREQAESLIRKNGAINSIYTYGRTYLIVTLPDEWVDPDYLSLYGYGEYSEGGRTPVEIGIYVLPDEVFASFAKECKVDASAYEEAEQLRLLYLNEGMTYNSETQRYERSQIFQNVGNETLEAGRFYYGADGDDSLIKTGEAALGDGVSRMPEEIERDSDTLEAFIPETMYEKFADTFFGKTTLLNIQCDDPSKTDLELEKELKEKGLEDVGWMTNLYAEYEADRNALMAVKVLTYGFIILISLISVANVFNTISTNLMLRRKEFAMLRSMGMSPRGLRRMMNYECVIYGMRAICYGVVLSILLGLALQRIIGVGADVEFLIPWRYLFIAVIGVFAVVFVTMLYTMHKIKQNNIVEELKMN